MKITTAFTELMGCELPIIGGPMFLVSDEDLVVAVSEAGGVGGVPSLNWRSTEEFRAAVKRIKARTQKPFAINLIVNAANPRMEADLAVCKEERVPLVITSLGNPKRVIESMHSAGGRVFCDVVNLEYALKVQEQGADGVVAVSSGAGGHAGPISPLVLYPYLKKHLRIPIVAAGGVSTGAQMAACFALGTSAVQIGTRLIASTEAKVDEAYKRSILESPPEAIVLTNKISGTPLSVINTPYVQSMGLDLNPVERWLTKNPRFKKTVKQVRLFMGSEKLRSAILGPTYKQVWSAGQGCGLIEEVKPAAEIMRTLTTEYKAAFEAGLPRIS
jgi:nitronate monooxygenase